MARKFLILISILFFAFSANAGIGFTQNVCSSYYGLLKSYGFTNAWNFNEASGTSISDSIGSNTATVYGSPSLNQLGPLATPSKSILLNGSNQYISTSTLVSNPSTFTISAWFKTSSASGKIIGFGSSQTGLSGSYDRHIYLNPAGQIIFGVNPSGARTIASTLGGYNDNKWHFVVGTVGAGTMSLYIDGDLVGTNTATGGENFNGHWRIGYDHLNGWPTPPGSFYLSGSIGPVAVSTSSAILVAQVQQLYSIGASCSNTYISQAPAKKLSFSVSTVNVLASLCSSVINITSNYAAGVGGLNVNLSNNGSGFTFYSDSNCTNTITSSTIPSGSFSTSVYAMGSVVSSPIITASAATYNSPTATVNVNTNPFIWTGGGANANWSTALNWAGGVVPGSSNVATFTDACVSNCSPIIAANINVNSIRMSPSYVGTITQNSGSTITVGGAGWIMLSGIFVGANSDINLSGPLVLLGGNFTSTAGNFTSSNGAHVTIGSGAVFNANSGIVKLNTNKTVSVDASVIFNNVELINGTNGPYILLTVPLNVDGDLTVGHAANNGSYSGTINVKKNVTFSGNSNGLKLNLVGSGTQNLLGTVTGLTLASLNIAALGTVNFNTTDTPNFLGDFTYSSGNVNFINTTVGFIHGLSSNNIITCGGLHLPNIEVGGYNGGRFSLVGTLYVDGNLTMLNKGCTYCYGINDSSIELLGNFSSISNAGNVNSILNFSGSSQQSISVTASLRYNFARINVNNSAGVIVNTNLNSDVQYLNLISGSLDMNGINLTVWKSSNSGTLTLNGNTLTKNGGVLSVNSVAVGIGSLYGGTVNP